jgi:hypothetical protein
MKVKTLNVLLGIAVGALVAFVVGVLLYHALAAAHPDCAPKQTDGQCGLATFSNFVEALSGGVLAWLIAAWFLSFYLLRRLARRRFVSGSQNPPVT